MKLEELKEQHQKLAIQRLQSKDVVDQLERAMAQFEFGIKVLEEQSKSEAPKSE